MSVWFEPAVNESLNNDEYLETMDADIDSEMELPPEILEKILQLMPASHHHFLTSVSKTWHSVLTEPLLKREVLVNSDHFDNAWQAHYQTLFALKIYAEHSPAVQAYEHILSLWVMRFVSHYTRTLILSGEICNKAHLLWPSLRQLLANQCPKLKKIVFQKGQVRLDVLWSMPDTVECIGLEECRVVKRHREEGFTECVLAMKGHQRVGIDLRRVPVGKFEEFLRNAQKNPRTDRKDSC